MTGVSPELREKMRRDRILTDLKAIGVRFSPHEIEPALAEFEPVWAAASQIEREVFSQFISGMIVEALQGIVIISRQHQGGGNG